MTQPIPPSADVAAMPDATAFQRWIDEYPRGALAIDLSKALAECVTSTQNHGRASTLTLKVTIAKGESGFGNDLAVTADVSAKPARPKPPKVTFFATDEGGLSRRDPNQQTIYQELDR